MNMGRLLAIVSLALIVAPLMTGCYYNGPIIRGSGQTTTKSFELSDFTGVNVSNAIRATIKQGESYSVSVTADDNLWDHMKVRTNGKTLELGLQPGAYNNTHISAEITMPALDSLTLSGASQGTVNGFKSTSPLAMDLSGASRASGDAQAASAEISLSGASNISLSGAANSLSLDASGASRADLASFPLDKASVTLSGASNATLNVKSNLDYDLSGASHLTYSGQPSVGKSSTSGASSVQSK
jgi:hypothetical protein